MVRYRLTRLPGGTRVVSAEMQGTRTVALGLWVGVGGRHETAARSGISHFLEHVLFKGTTRRSSRAIAAAVEEVGGHLNGFTAEDHTCIHAQAAARHLPRLADVLLDMLLHPRFTRADVERERHVIREEISMIQDNPGQRAEELLASSLWPDHPLGRPITGGESSVDAIDTRALVDHHRRHYTGANLTVAAAGQLSHEHLLQLVGPQLESLPRGRPARARPWHPAPHAPRARVDLHPTEQAHLSLGFHALGRDDPRRFALRLLSVILGESLTSRLFQQLRERRAYCYSIGSSTDFLAETGALYVDASLDPDRLAPALRAIHKEIGSLRDRAVGPRELRRARDYILGQTEMSLEQPANHMNWIAESILAHHRVVEPGEIESRLATVDPQQLQQIARDLLDPHRAHLVLVTAPEQPPAPEQLLDWFG